MGLVENILVVPRPRCSRLWAIRTSESAIEAMVEKVKKMEKSNDE
jgi:hypothetical protein